VADGSSESRPRGLGPCDLLTAEELALLLHCRKAEAVAWAEVRRLGLPGPGRATLYSAGEVHQALKDDRERRERPATKPVIPLPPVALELAEITPNRSGPRRGGRART
jgi:hypothetical protein